MYICHNAYIGVVLGVNVSIYGSPMECLGIAYVQSPRILTIFKWTFVGQGDRACTSLTMKHSFPVSVETLASFQPMF